eukprot:SAG11_NODE_3070_length_2714_cov_1.624092_2_plen_322_part_00
MSQQIRVCLFGLHLLVAEHLWCAIIVFAVIFITFGVPPLTPLNHHCIRTPLTHINHDSAVHQQTYATPAGQTLVLLLNIPLEWPPALRSALNLFRVLNFIDLELARPECTGPFTFEDKLKLTVYMPFGLLVLVFLFTAYKFSRVELHSLGHKLFNKNSSQITVTFEEEGVLGFRFDEKLKIKKINAGTPASLKSELRPGLMLARIQNQDVDRKTRKQTQLHEKLLPETRPLTLVFTEPGRWFKDDGLSWFKSTHNDDTPRRYLANQSLMMCSTLFVVCSVFYMSSEWAAFVMAFAFFTQRKAILREAILTRCWHCSGNQGI